jgi:hypothetical protein
MVRTRQYYVSSGLICSSIAERNTAVRLEPRSGACADPLRLQYVAGHDNIKTNMRCVQPCEDAVEKLFVRWGNLPRPETRVECKRSMQNPV